MLTDLVDVAGAADDIALIAVRLPPEPLHLDLPANPAVLSRVRRQVADWAAGSGLDADTTQDLELALGEAVANSVEHAYRDSDRPGRVQVTLDRAAGSSLVVTVTDTGTWQPPAADPGHRGRGLQMINTLAADVELHHSPGGTVLRFRLLPTPAVIPRSAARSVPDAAEGDAGGHAAVLVTSEVEGRPVLKLTGDLDLAGATAVRDAVLTALAGDDRPAVLDLTGLGFLASVGVGLLLEATLAARAHRDLDVRLPAAGAARHALDLTGLSAVFQRPTAE